MKRTKKILFFNLNVNETFDNVSHFRFLYNNKKKKNFEQIVKINQKLSEKQKHNIDHKKSYDDET